jgi:hypothetical protein
MAQVVEYFLRKFKTLSSKTLLFQKQSVFVHIKSQVHYKKPQVYLSGGVPEEDLVIIEMSLPQYIICPNTSNEETSPGEGQKRDLLCRGKVSILAHPPGYKHGL